MNPATPRPRPGRPATAPAYYLGRPASVWIAIARRRVGRAAGAEAASQQTAGVDRIGAANEANAERAA
jgi:hypothetical protein